MKVFTLIIALMMLSFLSSYSFADGDIIIYSEDFSSDPGWITNNPQHFYWDTTGERYYYNIIDATEEYSYYPLPELASLLENYPGSFELTYDVLPTTTDWAGNFRCGVSDSNMSEYEPTSIVGIFHWADAVGHAIVLHIWDNTGRQGLRESPHSFQDSIIYQVTLGWNNVTWDVSMKVIEKQSGDSIWSDTISGLGPFFGMDRIFMSSIGDSGYPGRYAKGYIDNIVASFTPFFLDSLIVGSGATCLKSDEMRVPLYVSNHDTLAAMTIPLRYETDCPSLTVDSGSFVGTRIEDWELKDRRISEDTVALFLMADMGGGTPPLPPGEGPIAYIYFSIPCDPENVYDTCFVTFDTTTVQPEDQGLLFVDNHNNGFIPSFEPGTTFVALYRPGDVNGNCVINVGDVVYLISYLFKGGPEPCPLDAGDVNGDCSVWILEMWFI